MSRAFKDTLPKPFRGRRVRKPWGHEWIWGESPRYAGKILHVKAGEALSWQYHRKKDETICVLSGDIRLEIAATDDGPRRTVRLSPGKSFRIPALLRHRIIAVTDSDVIEASSPELDDVVRLEDRYGRAKN